MEPSAPGKTRRFALPLQIVLAVILGVVVGLLWPKTGAAMQPLGTAFINAVKMIVIPIVFCAVTLGAMKMGRDAPRLGRMALIAFVWFYFSSAVAIAIGLILDTLFHPGLGIHLDVTGPAPSQLTNGIDWVKFLLELIPSNIVSAMANQKVLPTLLFAVLFGLGLSAVGEPRAKPMADVLESVLAVMFRVTNWIVSLAPIAVFGVVAWLFASQGSATVWALARLIGVAYLGYTIFGLLCVLGFAWLGEPPIALTRAMSGPTLLGFVTRSSEASLPLHMEKLEQWGIPNRIVSVILPLGYSFNLAGAALYIGLATTFIAEAYGLRLALPQLLTVLATALIASKGVANVPSASLIAISTVLLALGIPADAIAIIAGVDVFLDMGRTAINVFGNTLSVLVARRYGEGEGTGG
ncbi:MAG TPA: dicarboxylate/amino acid:cation symporter [Steroidobacteraceae bacterium]|jgi:DAACS family dicarboxylate/amino acid:cation (Na+ or H+) symporter|nr:dicarboxylate/amino acid:cation symporter [Steroidobacteraceae bacterium]